MSRIAQCAAGLGLLLWLLPAFVTTKTTLIGYTKPHDAMFDTKLQLKTL